MENLESGALKIWVTNNDDRITITWMGKSEDRNPEIVLNPYVDGLLNSLKDKKVILDFKNLEFMNSSTIPPIIRLMKKLEDEGISTEIIYNSSNYWQVFSFEILEQLSSLMAKVTIRGE